MKMKKSGRSMTAILAVAVSLLMGSVVPAAADRLDPDDPHDAILIQQKLNCSLNEGETVIYWWQGGGMSRMPGEKDRKLFNVQGMNIRQCANVEDDERGHGYRSVSREVMLYLDPETNEVLRSWENPWTGETVDVHHVSNDPVNMRSPRHAIAADGTPTTFNGTFMNGRVWTKAYAPLYYKNPLAGDYQEYVGGWYHSMEMLNNYAYEDELLDPTVRTLPRHTIAWARTSKWLPWMKMNKRSGFMLFTTVGKRVNSIDDLSEPLRSEIRNNYATYLQPPPLDDSRDNVTSWAHFKTIIDAQRAADATQETTK